MLCTHPFACHGCLIRSASWRLGGPIKAKSRPFSHSWIVFGIGFGIYEGGGCRSQSSPEPHWGERQQWEEFLLLANVIPDIQDQRLFTVLQLEGVSVVYLTKCHSLILFVSFSTEKGRYYFRDKPAHSSKTPPACSAESVNHLLTGCGKKNKKLACSQIQTHIWMAVNVRLFFWTLNNS